MGWLQWEFRPVYPKVCGPLPPMGGEGREGQGKGEVAGEGAGFVSNGS